MKLESRKLEELVPYVRNSRTHSDAQIAQIAGSIREFGFTNPVLIDGQNGIIAGHGRLLAARKLALTEVPTIVLNHLTEAQKRALIIADNQLALNAGWDLEQLKLEIMELDNKDFDLDLLGFDEDFLKGLQIGEPVAGLTDEDDVPEVEQNIHGVVLGDIWFIGNHRLMCGDSTDKSQVEKLLAGEIAEMSYCDPPYGVNIVNASGKLNGDKPFGNIGNMRSEIAKAGNYKPIVGDETTETAKKSFEICSSITKTQIFWGSQYYAEYLPPSSGWLVWDKQTDGSLGDGELAYTNIKKAVRIFSHKWSGMIKASEQGQRRVHPTQKPIALAEWCFENYGDPKLILDLFLGSGSTLIACEKTGRRCFGMEIDPYYCSVIIERWQKFTGKKAERCTVDQ